MYNCWLDQQIWEFFQFGDPCGTFTVYICYNFIWQLLVIKYMYWQWALTIFIYNADSLTICVPLHVTHNTPVSVVDHLLIPWPCKCVYINVWAFLLQYQSRGWMWSLSVSKCTYSFLMASCEKWDEFRKKWEDSQEKWERDGGTSLTYIWAVL